MSVAALQRICDADARDPRAHPGWPPSDRGALSPEPLLEDQPSMLRQRIATTVHPGVGGSRASRPRDRAMDVLQYGTAILAFAAAVILAFLH
jgi:hypothetical protein